MNEEQVKKILEIEDEAQELYERALKTARQLPISAQAEARLLIDSARNSAIAEAEVIVRKVREEASSSLIIDRAEEESKRKETVAGLHFEHAVYFVLDRLMGRV